MWMPPIGLMKLSGDKVVRRPAPRLLSDEKFLKSEFVVCACLYIKCSDYESFFVGVTNLSFYTSQETRLPKVGDYYCSIS